MRRPLGVAFTVISVLLVLSASAPGADWTEGEVSVTWELAPPQTATAGEEFSATAAANYIPNMPAETEWEYTTVEITFQWEANPEGSAEAGRQPTGGGGGGVSYKSQASLTYTAPSATENDKTVRVRAHVTGTVLDYGADGVKGTGDEVTYAIDEWSGWREEALTVYSEDTDGDGMPDEWENLYGLDPFDATGVNGSGGDLDEDGHTNGFEQEIGTEPNDAGSGLVEGTVDVVYSLLLGEDEEILEVIHETLPVMTYAEVPTQFDIQMPYRLSTWNFIQEGLIYNVPMEEELTNFSASCQLGGYDAQITGWYGWGAGDYHVWLTPMSQWLNRFFCNAMRRVDFTLAEEAPDCTGLGLGNMDFEPMYSDISFRCEPVLTDVDMQISGDTFGDSHAQAAAPYMADPEPRESFTDTNDNGLWDTNEPYEDRDGDGTYDRGEVITVDVSVIGLPKSFPGDGANRVVTLSWPEEAFECTNPEGENANTKEGVGAATYTWELERTNTALPQDPDERKIQASIDSVGYEHDEYENIDPVTFGTDAEGDDIEVRPKAIAGAAETTTLVTAEFIDDEPGYSLDSDTDSDNYFLRQQDQATGQADYKNLDIVYRIKPAGVSVSDVKINVYQEDTSTKVMFGSEDHLDGAKDASGDFKTGDNLKVKWEDVRDASGNFRDAGFYRLELEVYVDGATTPICKTPINDAEASVPGWQCPQQGLAVHDLIWKHRPSVYVGSNEIVAPNGPCYPFDDDVIGSGSTTAPNYRLRKDGGEAWAVAPNYSEWGDFPDPAPNFMDESYKYPVLSASDSHSATSEHAIGMFGQGESTALGITNDEPIIQGAQLPACLGYHGIPHPDDTNNHVFIHWWMYETASYAPYGAPGAFVHDADWEMVQLCLELRHPQKPDRKAKWLEPWAATASQHYYGQTLGWRRKKEGSGTADPRTQENQRYVLHVNGSAGERFRIYIAENAHATYFQSGDIDAAITAETGTQCQYDNAPELSYDACENPGAPQAYSLIPLVDKNGAGIYDWQGIWNTHHDAGYEIRGPAHRQAHPSITIAEEPVVFHNRCRKHVDASGDFDENGQDDAETELRQVP